MDYSPWSEREIWPFFESSQYLQNQYRPRPPKLVCMHNWHQLLTSMNFLKPIPIRLNFLMTMDYSPWSEREIWPFLRVVNISETGDIATPTKIGMTCITDINSLLAWHFLSQFWTIKFFDPHGLYIAHGSEREIWPFLEVVISLKPDIATPTKIGMTCITDINVLLAWNFLSQFQSIKFFDDHGL